MSTQQGINDIPTINVTASAELLANRLLTLTGVATGTTAAYTGANGFPEAFTDVRLPNGSNADVPSLKHALIVYLTASKAVAVNTAVYPAASGKFTDSAGSSPSIGKTLLAAGADGDVVPVLIAR